MHSFRVGGSSLPTFERSVNKRRCCLSRLDRVPPRSVSVLYSIATGSLVSLFRRFPRLRAEGRKRGGRKSGGEGDRRLCPRFHVMQKVGPVCFDVSFPGGCSCREIADHGRGVKSRLSSNLLSFHANFSRCSLRSAIHVPPSFFFMRAPISFLASAFSNRI